MKFLVVAVDYFTKWIEAKPLPCITRNQLIKFIWMIIITRFESPKVLVSDKGVQFVENPLRNWCVERGIGQRFKSVAHHQANGQTEVSNRTSVHGIKKRLGKEKGNWVYELPEVHWSYQTTPWTSTRETMFNLAYEAKEMLPVEITMSSIWTEYFEGKENDENLRENLDLLEEWQEHSSMSQAAYKKIVERYYNQRVKNKVFWVGDYVLRKNGVSHAQPRGKLSQTWEGPYKVVEAHHNGSYSLETPEGRQIP